MTRVSKPPEIRKQELVDTALSLFMEKGYEAVSVRDILKVVNGHPGMFYYYFESKQEIYNEAMRQMIQAEVSKRTLILSDKSKPILTRFKELFSLISNGIRDYYKAFNNPDSLAYETTVLLDLLTAMAEPVSQFILEAREEGIIPPEVGITEETAYPISLFIIHGCYGLVHIDNVMDSLSNIKYFIPFIAHFLQIPQELLEQSLK
jgi:Transcriptional regulator